MARNKKLVCVEAAGGSAPPVEEEKPLIGDAEVGTKRSTNGLTAAGYGRRLLR